jgi:ABC-type sugar transport system ATPase subunit
MTSTSPPGTPGTAATPNGGPVLAATGLTKSYGRVEALRGSDFELLPGEILAVIGDNGAGKSTLIKCLSGATIPDSGQMYLDGLAVHFRDPQQAQQAGIETVYQTLAVSPALDIASNIYLGREIRKKGPLGSILRLLDTAAMRRGAHDHIKRLGIETLQDITQAVETLSGGQRQAVAVARAAAFGSKIVILDEHRPHQTTSRQRHADRAHQPQHAPRLRTRRPHPHPTPRQPRRRHHPENPHHGRRRRHHDRRPRRMTDAAPRN